MVYRRLMTGVRTEGAPPGESLSPLAVGLLYHLARHGGRSPSDLAQEMAMARPNVTALVRELARQGLVARRSGGAGRGRRSVVELSASGQDAVARLRRTHLEYFTAMLSRLGAGDLHTLGESARNVSEILGKLAPETTGF